MLPCTNPLTPHLFLLVLMRVSLAAHLVQAGVDDLIADGLQVVMDLHPVDDEVADVLVAHDIPHPVTG